MLCFLASLILGCFVIKELWMRWKYDLHMIPTPPKVPILGHALALRKGNKTHAINVWIQEWRAKLGFPKVMKLCLLGHTIILVADTKLVRNIVLAKSHANPRNGPLFRQFQRMLMGDDPTPCMFTSQTTTPYVKVIRRSYTASFTTTAMKTILKKQMQVMHQGKLYLEERLLKDTIDLQDFFTRLMLDVAGKTELDMDLGGLDNSSPLCKLIIQYGHHMRALGTRPFLELRTKLFPNSKLAQRINKDIKDLENQWTRITQEVCNRGVPNDGDVTMAANLRRVCMPGTNDPLPFNLLRGELTTSIIGGFDSISHQLAWIFALLATHPDVVEKLIDELKTRGLYGEDSRELEFEDLSELKYLTAVVKEGMRRVHTLLFVAGRSAKTDLVLDGYRIPEGALLLVCSNLSMNCKMEWEDHLAFKPERWIQDNTDLKEKYYFPFGFGDRDCAGMKFALQSMKVTIVYLITRFSFELVGDTIESLVQNGVAGVVFEAKDGINMKVTPRKET